MTEAVLIVEDARSVAASYAEALDREGWRAEIVGDVEGALSRLKRGRYGAVLLDLMLPDGDGLAVLKDLGDRPGQPPVVAVTSDGSISRAVEATRLGAFDFLVKPVSREKLVRAIGAAASRGRAAPPRAQIGEFGIIGSSPAVKDLRKQLVRVAGSDATVFVTGESGVGKELCANAVHAASGRAREPFMALNCGAIPGDLLESILFGHVRGAFTGAVSDNLGAARSADGGTLFLDEICEMDVGLQTKMLRFLETGAVTPVGDNKTHPVDVRIICATNRDPRAEIAAGRFREDLFYRLHVLPVHAPALRERGDDVLEIADFLLAKFSNIERKQYEGFSASARAALRNAHWPGNVRELINVVRQAVVLGDGGWISPDLLRLSPTAAPAHPAAAPTAHTSAPVPHHAPQPAPAALTLEDAAERLCRLPLADIERLVIDAAIRDSGSAPKAAKSLRVSPSTIYRKLESWEGRPSPTE